MTASLYDGNGRPVRLGRELGRGGEGSVYEVIGAPDRVAKLYHSAVPNEKAEKLAVLSALATPRLTAVAAWPTDTLADKPGGFVRGLLMPKAEGRLIHVVYSPAQRRQLYPKSDWTLLVHVAMNVAAAVQTIHESGCVVGDLNQGGFHVSDQGTVRLIDCDSFQVRGRGRTFRCTVRVPDFTPPELHSVDLTTIDATTEHDSFALGLIVFHLLFMGRHPFAGRYTGPGDMPIQQAILERRFAFSGARSTFQMDVPTYAPDLRFVPPALGDLFERAFRGDPLRRPAAADWFRELQALRSSLRKCGAEPTHVYSPHANECPWCRLERGGAPSYFVLAAVSFDFENGFDFAGLWRQVEQLAEPPTPQQFVDAVSRRPPPPVPRDLPDEVKYRRLGPPEAIPGMPVLDLLPYPEVPTFQPVPRPGEPGCGYVAEPVPALPADFVPDTVPPDPLPVLDPVPDVPVVRPADCTVGAVQRYRSARRSGEYLTAQWCAVTTFLVALMLYLAHQGLLASFLAIPVGGGFAFVWLVMWVRAHRRFRSDSRVADGEQKREDARVAAVVQRAEAKRTSVEAENRRREAHCRHQAAELQRQRARLPDQNDDKKRRWLADRTRVEQAIATIEVRNAERLHLFEAAAAAADGQRRRAWEGEVARVTAARSAITLENQRRRALWESALPLHHDRVRAIAALNDQRNVARQAYEQAVDARQSALKRDEAEFGLIVDRWSAERSVADQKLASARWDLMRSRGVYLKMKGEFEQERDKLTLHARQNQLDDHLRQHLIATAVIPEIGKGRKAKLAAFGIETAYDIADHRLAAVHGEGFGPQRLGHLRDWRIACERTFVFNPQKQVASPALRQLHLKFQSERLASQASLKAGLQTIRDVVTGAMIRFDELHRDATAAATRIAQCQADLRLARGYDAV